VSRRQTALAIAGIVLPRLAFIAGMLLAWWVMRH
jgi:hypothetical protein